MADRYDWQKDDQVALREALLRVYEEALTRIASATCDHGPGICPRQLARVALGWRGVGAMLNEQTAHRAPEVKP